MLWIKAQNGLLVNLAQCRTVFVHPETGCYSVKAYHGKSGITLARTDTKEKAEAVKARIEDYLDGHNLLAVDLSEGT